MKRISKLLLENFWARNGLLLAAMTIMQQSVRPEPGLYKKLFAFSISIGIYCWFIFHNRVLLDRYLFKKKPLIYLAGLAAGFAYYLMLMLSYTKKTFSTGLVTEILLYALFNTLMASLFYLGYKYFREQDEMTRNRIYMFEMEQKYLKAQLSPHFLFNSLNNIYSYSLEQSSKTPELILKLSELMRYLIEFNKHSCITLSEELDFISNYIAFEKERLEDRCEIVFEKQIADEEKQIEPLLFFPLVENAFKHGTNTMGNCYVRLYIKQQENTLDVTIKNRIIANAKPSTHSGMENVEKRLQLFYRDRYSLDINRQAGEYAVHLSIQLN